MSATPTAIDPAVSDTLLETVREQITLEQFDITNQAIIGQMVECLGDGRGTMRLAFAEALGEIGEPAVPQLLQALRQHANVVVRRAAAKTLTLIADPSSIPELVDALLYDEDTVVKGSSVGALARMGEAAVPVLLDILASPELPESTKGHAAWALAFIGAEAKELLYGAMAAATADVRYALIGAIAKVAQDNPSDGQAFQLLMHGLKDEDVNVRIEAAAALGNLTYQPAIPLLSELLQHDDWETRKAAVLSLMKIGVGEIANPARCRILALLEARLPTEPEAAVQTVINLATSLVSKKLTEVSDS